MILQLFFFFFFFQAEDGIRDVAVTGVQTCALPIFRTRHRETSICWMAKEGPSPSFGCSASPGGDQRFFQRRSEEHTSELQSRLHLVCRLLLEKKKKKKKNSN